MIIAVFSVSIDEKSACTGEVFGSGINACDNHGRILGRQWRGGCFACGGNGWVSKVKAIIGEQMRFGHRPALVPFKESHPSITTWHGDIIDTAMHNVGLHRFKVEAVLEVVKLCADANAA